MKKLFFLIATLMVLTLPGHAFAFGISPASLKVMNLYKTSAYQHEFHIVRSSAVKDEDYVLETNGDLGSYITFPAGNRIHLKRGQTSAVFLMRFQTSSLPTGKYTGTFTVSQATDPTATESAVLSSIQVHFGVNLTNDTNQKISVVNPTIDPLEVGMPITFQYSVNNQGSVDDHLKSAHYRILDASSTQTLLEGDADLSKDPFIKVGAIETRSIFVDNTLSAAKYHAEISFQTNGTSTFPFTGLSFEVFPKGTLHQVASLVQFSSDKTQYEKNEIVGFSLKVKNDGSVSIDGKPVIEIYHEGKHVSDVSMSEAFIAAGQVGEYAVNFTPTENGSYQAKLRMPYGTSALTSDALTFQVGHPVPVALYGGIGALFFLLIVVLIIWLKSRRKTPPVAPVAATKIKTTRAKSTTPRKRATKTVKSKSVSESNSEAITPEPTPES